jgi:hypothetical protein
MAEVTRGTKRGLRVVGLEGKKPTSQLVDAGAEYQDPETLQRSDKRLARGT